MLSEGEEGKPKTEVGDDQTDGDKNSHSHDSKVYPDHDLANIVDHTLDQHDAADDGYIDYAEFVTAQRKAIGKTDN